MSSKSNIQYNIEDIAPNVADLERGPSKDEVMERDIKVWLSQNGFASKVRAAFRDYQDGVSLETPPIGLLDEDRFYRILKGLLGSRGYHVERSHDGGSRDMVRFNFYIAGSVVG